MTRLLLMAILLMPCVLLSQEDAWVYFTDKEDVATSIANPLSILTQEAIDRKALHNVAIDERDVPVNETYITTVKAQEGITVLAKSKWFNCVHVRGSETAITALEELAFVGGIEFADTSLNSFTDGFGLVDKQLEVPVQQRVTFNYGASENQVTMLSVDFLHEQDFTGAGMIVAVLDSGFPGVDVNGGFARLRDNDRLLDGYDFVDRNDDEFAFEGSSHGTRTMSDIAGFIEDQFVGTAPDVSIYCFRTEDVASENPVEESYWVEAAERADSLGVDIINTSLGYRNYDNPAYSYTYEDMNGETAFISRGATQAFQKGMLLVTSAGNSGTDMISAPADSPGVLTVGAVDGNGNYASFSSIGPSSDGRIKPDVMAKGSGSAVIDQNNNVTTSSGTSFSSPIMAGAVASLWQAIPERTNAEVMQLVREAAHLFDNPTPEMGYGIPDFETLFEALSVTDNAFAKAYQISPNPAQNQFELLVPQGITNAEVAIYDILGKKISQTSVTSSNQVIDSSFLKQGVYLIQIVDNQGVSSLKLIKR